jgi:hypothetical protein
VAEGVLGVRRAAASARRDEQEHLGGGVRDRVGGLGLHRRRAGQQAGYGLARRDGEVGRAGHHDRQGAFAGSAHGYPRA